MRTQYYVQLDRYNLQGKLLDRMGESLSQFRVYPSSINALTAKESKEEFSKIEELNPEIDTVEIYSFDKFRLGGFLIQCNMEKKQILTRQVDD